ncbi:MAG: FkbM family methyltransferase [Streptomycetales bacterium]
MFVPGPLTAGAREMYCRNVYLRTGLTMPAEGWVIDLGANAGLFTLLAATEGARVVAVEAQHGFTRETARLLDVNNIEQTRVHIETALAAAGPHVALVGTLADDNRWRAASHAAAERPGQVSVPELMRRYGIDRVGLLKMDIEGGEFTVLHHGSDLSWLARVDQIAMEVHPQYGDVSSLLDVLHQHGFAVHITDNVGRIVPEDSIQASYLYCRR